MFTQRRQSRPHHTGRIYAKELAHRRPGVASAKAVGAEGGVTAPWWQIRPYRLRRGAHAVGGGDDRPATLCQLVGQEGGRARLRVGVGMPWRANSLQRVTLNTPLKALIGQLLCRWPRPLQRAVNRFLWLTIELTICICDHDAKRWARRGATCCLAAPVLH